MLSGDCQYYRVDGLRGFHEIEWFFAASDEDAISKVLARFPNEPSEIWQRKRFVAKLSPNHFDPDDPELQRAVGERLSALAQRIKREQGRSGRPG